MADRGGFLLRFGLLLGCLALAAVNTGNNLLYLILSLLLAVAIVAFTITGRSLRRVDARLLMPEEVAAGRPFMLGVEATAAAGRLPSPWARVSVPGLGAGAPEMALPAMPPGGRTVVSATARAERRGIHRGVGIDLRSSYPFSLFRRRRRLPRKGTLVVTPRIFPIRSMTLPAPGDRGSVAASRAGDGVDLFNIRDYTPEDDARHIDWKASARVNRPMLREFEREHEQALDLVLDERPVREAAAGAFDAMVETAASILDHCARRGIRARLVVAGDGSGAAALEGRAAMTYLAGAQPRSGPVPQLYGSPQGAAPRIVLSLDPAIGTPFQVEWEERSPGP